MALASVRRKSIARFLGVVGITPAGFLSARFSQVGFPVEAAVSRAMGLDEIIACSSVPFYLQA